MQQLYPLESRSWAASQPVQISLDNLPKGKRVRSLMLHVAVSGTKDAADAVAITNFPKAITNIRVGEYCNLSGMDLFLLNWAIAGRIVQAGTAIPGSGTTFSIAFVLEIPFRDPRQPGSDDGSMPCELFDQVNLEITWGAAACYATGNAVITAGTVYPVAECVSETNTPQICRLLAVAPNSQTMKLDPGVYKELIAVKTDYSTIAATDLGSFYLECDGKAKMANVLHRSLIHAWNKSMAVGATNSEQVVDAAYFQPIVFHDRFGKSNLTKQPLCEKEGKLQIVTGTATPKLIMWRVEPKSADTVAAVAEKIGAPADATTYEPAVASKSANQKALDTPKAKAMAKFLPGKLRAKPRTA